jgi:hypothetical protein
MRWPPTPRRFAEEVVSLVRRTFIREGHLDPVAFVFATRHPETGLRIDPTLLMYLPAGPASSFAQQLTKLAREVHASMVIQAYEIRMRGALSEQPARGFEPLGEDAEAKDYVVLFVEAPPLRTFAWLAPVETRGTPTVGRFEEVAAPRVEGWLTAILPWMS